MGFATLNVHRDGLILKRADLTLEIAKNSNKQHLYLDLSGQLSQQQTILLQSSSSQLPVEGETAAQKAAREARAAQADLKLKVLEIQQDQLTKLAGFEEREMNISSTQLQAIMQEIEKITEHLKKQTDSKILFQALSG